MSYESDSHLTRHSPAYYDGTNPSTSAQTPYYRSAPRPLQQPPIARVSPTLRSPSVPHGLDPVRLQTSISSGESGSTVGAEYKQYPTYKHFQYGPQVERGIIEDSTHRQSRAGSQHSGNRANESHHGGAPVVEDNSAIFQYIQEKSLAVEEEQEDDHALWILLWMSFLDPFHCLFSALYSVFAAILITILAPLRLCRQECSPSISLVRLVAPIFRNHLQLIYAKSLDNAHTFEFSPFCLVLVHAVSPIISIGNAVAAWIVAVFWVFAIVMGNPDGTEKRDDGRATVLLLRDWWEKYLLFAIRK
ncbi:hypothetical protein CLCR_11291 [Cladophialophora carrionii]|uniref:Uncharacterized protein n=1 Tax=Cladophialophora carrionii TaxID=86049 RepID=A0A1C1CHJ8_9EURO|nr:hypothetical protein CLCR_11291 [Cladophialophora carrionii]